MVDIVARRNFEYSAMVGIKVRDGLSQHVPIYHEEGLTDTLKRVATVHYSDLLRSSTQG